jgi:NAD-dependent dihydropyrimidine dehydrogenase PreA subunit
MAYPVDSCGLCAAGIGEKYSGGDEMTYVIAEPCISVKDHACVDVCPVDCIYDLPDESADQLFIHPEECIDCGACEPECPVTAIFEDAALPEEWQQYTEINAQFFVDHPDAKPAPPKGG